jgi:hypothetical protein
MTAKLSRSFWPERRQVERDRQDEPSRPWRKGRSRTGIRPPAMDATPSVTTLTLRVFPTAQTRVAHSGMLCVQGQALTTRDSMRNRVLIFAIGKRGNGT